MIPFSLICVLSGFLPAIMLPIRSALIDAALMQTGGFVIWCASFLLLAITGEILSAAREWMTVRQQLVRARELDQDRMNHAARISYPLTETESFHSLCHQAEQAPELEEKCFGAWQNILLILVRMVTVGITLLWIDWITAAGILVLLMTGIGIHLYAAKETPGFWGRYMENMRRTNYFASLLLHREYAAERKLFDWGEAIGNRFTKEFRKARYENRQLGIRRLKADTVLEGFSALYAVCTVLLLLRPLESKIITIGMFTSAFYAVNTMSGQIGQLCGAVYTLKSSFSQLESYDVFMQMPESEPQTSVADTQEHAVIRFQDVTFTYPGQEKPVLQHLNLCMEAGKHYALVGENGSGKSTLVKLMTGLYQPDSGEILIGGKPLRACSDAEKQKLFTVVFQDFYRYPLTIRENLSLGHSSLLTEKQILPVLTMLEFHPDALSRGLDTDLMLLQKEGTGLSGGEWQKLTIARSMLSSAPIAILDEPNASLDPVAEAQVYGAYQTLLQQKTTLFISHRLGSVRDSDSIFVLRDGKLLTEGKHDDLMRTCSYYRELYETQRGLYDEI